MSDEPKETTQPESGDALPEALRSLRDAVSSLLGSEAQWELRGTLPSFRLPAEAMHAACERLKQAGWDYLLFVTAVDYPEENRIEMVYAISNYRDGCDLALVCDLDRKRAEIASVADVWIGADWHERETYDLLGIRFRNHPDLRRILLDNTWEGHPLRKDYVDTVHDVIKRPY